MYKYVLIYNGEVKMFYKRDELSDAIQACIYARKFYHDTTLNSIKYSREKHCIELYKFKIDRGLEDVYSYSWQ